MVSADGTTMSPGNWGELFPPEGVSALDNGIYCLDGTSSWNAAPSSAAALSLS